jgi:hypothetical protein
MFDNDFLEKMTLWMKRLLNGRTEEGLLDGEDF